MDAVILTRVSSTEQEDGKSLKAQLENAQKYAEKKGLNVIRSFELVESSTVGKRKDFNNMLDFVKSQRGTIAIIADAVDRFQRRFNEAIIFDPLIQSGKVELHFVSNGLILHKNSSGNDTTMWRMCILMAESFITQLRYNTRRGLIQKRKDGELCGKAPAGYKNYRDENGRPSVKLDPELAPIIKQAFEEYASGAFTIKAVAERLQSRGLRTYKGNIISHQTVHKTLNNPFYCGYLTHFDETSPNKEDHKIVRFRHVYDAMISEELFDRCQRVLKRFNKTPYKYKNKFYTFSGLVSCANCGKSMSSYTKKKKDNEYVYMHCTQYGHDACGNKNVNEKVIEKQVMESLSILKVDDKLADIIREDLEKESKQEGKIKVLENKRNQQRLIEIKDKIDRLVDLKLENGIKDDIYKIKMESLSAELEELEKKTKTSNVDESEFYVSLKEVFDLGQEAGEIYKSSQIEQKRRLLNLIFANLQIKDKKLEFSYTKPFCDFAKGFSYKLWGG